MTFLQFASTGQAPAVVLIEAFAFHDATGRIRHMHHHVVLEGATPRAVEEMLEEVKAAVLARGKDLSKLRVLHVKTPFNVDVPHKVDVKRGVLVELRTSKRGGAPRSTPKKRKAAAKKR